MRSTRPRQSATLVRARLIHGEHQATLVPIGFAVTVRAEALTSRLTIETQALVGAFALGLFLVTRWSWRFGLRHASGASA